MFVGETQNSWVSYLPLLSFLQRFWETKICPWWGNSPPAFRNICHVQTLLIRQSSPESSHFLQYLSWFGVPAFPAGAQLLVCVGGSMACTSPATNALIGFLGLFFLLKIFKVPFFPHPFNPPLPLPALLTGERVAQAVLEDSIP